MANDKPTAFSWVTVAQGVVGIVIASAIAGGFSMVWKAVDTLIKG